MRIFVFVNRLQELGFRQTTALLVASLVRQQHEVWLSNFDTLSASAIVGQPAFTTRAIEVPSKIDCQGELVEQTAQSGGPGSIQSIEASDLMLIRTNPGRDTSRTQIHESFLHLCTDAQSAGIRVVNSPEKLRYFASKASLVSIPARFRPAMIVTRDFEQIVEFVKNASADCVAKPLFGSRGENVIRVSKSTSDLETKLTSTFGETTLVVQQFVESDHPGDKRVICVGGKILELDGHIAGIERHPASDDFRANLHAGGSAHMLSLSEDARTSAQYAARLLMKQGIWLAGVDLIGDKIIEFNVFSTGGLYDSIRFSNVRFDDVIAERLTTPQ